MAWFNGGVLDAIKACRQKKALLIVYISGKMITLLVVLDVYLSI